MTGLSAMLPVVHAMPPTRKPDEIHDERDGDTGRITEQYPNSNRLRLPVQFDAAEFEQKPFDQPDKKN